MRGDQCIFHTQIKHTNVRHIRTDMGADSEQWAIHRHLAQWHVLGQMNRSQQTLTSTIKDVCLAIFAAANGNALCFMYSLHKANRILQWQLRELARLACFCVSNVEYVFQSKHHFIVTASVK